MNKFTLTAAVAAVLLTSTAFAYTPKDEHKIVGPLPKLVPSHIVQPSNLPLSFTRSIVTIEFSLDASGRPQDIKVVSNADQGVKAQVVKAFAQWKFEPVSGATPAKRFVLPLDITPDV